MIKFFRKIRYDLMGKNKTRKYLKYAIGEIVLVVIGILIALSINNLNDNRILQNELSDYLKKIKDDISSDIQSAEEINKFRDSSKYYSHKYFETVKSSNLGMKDFRKVLNSQYSPFYPYALGSSKNGYIALINSGLIAKIDNPELKSSIFDYYELVEEVERNETNIYNLINFENRELFGNLGVLELYNYLSTNSDLITEKQEIWFKEFVKNPHLSNMHFRNIDDIGIQNGYLDIIKQGKHILQILEVTYNYKLTKS